MSGGPRNREVALTIEMMQRRRDCSLFGEKEGLLAMGIFPSGNKVKVAGVSVYNCIQINKNRDTRSGNSVSH